MAENATKCSAADGVTQTFDFCHGTPLMVRAVDFNALHAECQKMRKDAERYRKVRRGQHWSVVNGIGDTLRAEALDAAVDAAPAVGAA